MSDPRVFSALIATIGASLIAAVLLDAFLTMLGMRGGGFFTNRWTRAVWAALLAIHRRRRIHRTLAVAGPVLTIGTILIWYAMLVAGWLVVFASHPGAVMIAKNGARPTFIERLYFVSTSASTVGYGDIVPTRFPWTMLAIASAITATFVLSTSLSYLMPVLSAAIERRRLAQDIFSVGSDDRGILRNTWGNGSGSVMNTHWTTIFSRINGHAQAHLVYPVLHFFHNREEELSVTRAMLHLADALFLIAQTEDGQRPPPGFLSLGQTTIEAYADQKQLNVGARPEAYISSDAHLTRGAIAAEGFTPVDEPSFRDALEQYRPLRRRLVLLCAEDGW